MGAIGIDHYGREFRVVHLASVADWPTSEGASIVDFALFLACDADQVGMQSLLLFAKDAIKQRCALVCCWGPGSTTVEDIFDELAVTQDVDTNGVLMTTSHDETLEDALDYFVTTAFPDEAYAATPRLWLAVSIGAPSQATAISDALNRLISQ